MKPVRIQRKRTSGWRMPPNTVYVGRGSKWGNPFRTGPVLNAQECVAAFRYWLLSSQGDVTIADVRHELRGKNLACWCPVDAEHPCHADVLLEVANG